MPGLGVATYALKRWLNNQAAKVDQKSIIKQAHAEAEVSTGYFLVLTISNLIALSGLITNSMPVIIGAMLISPLMGPILNIGFAFMTGDNDVWQKSLRKIALGVGLTLVVAAAATYLSPMKDVTNEIIVRTRPNLYDLIIAFLAGVVGASAICTKKNYLTIVPGVAIATAVIPPLSVAGFGLGVWNLKILWGGFFLFFTNFVAIIISTCVVFGIYGIRPSILTEEDLSSLKKRVGALAVVLFVISLPLFYTLHKTIEEVRLRSSIQDVLKRQFDKEHVSSLASFVYKKGVSGINISATVNTVRYLKDTDIAEKEREVSAYLRKPASLYLDQILVQPGGLKEEINVKPTVVPPEEQARRAAEDIKNLRKNVILAVGQSASRLRNIIAPAELTGFSAGFDDKSQSIHVALKMKRDAPFSDEEMRWLSRMLADSVGMPVELEVGTEPFVPELVFKAGEVAVSEGMKKELAAVKDAYAASRDIEVRVESYPERPATRRSCVLAAQKRADAVRAALTSEFGIPAELVKTDVLTDRPAKLPAVRVSVLPAGK